MRAADYPHRTLILTVPDWPAIALALHHEIGYDTPVIVTAHGRVHTANAAARAQGVEPGMRKRAAQTRSPHATVLARDLSVEHRVFATGIHVLENQVARFSMLQPGTIAIPVSALRRTHASEDALVEELLVTLTDATGWEIYPGIADSPFAALLAATTQTRVAPGQTAEFLASKPVDTLICADPHRYADLVPLLHNLGLDRLGQLAALPRAHVHTRLTETGLRAWHLAHGHPESLPVEHIRDRAYQVFVRLETPTGRLDELSFIARGLATEFLTEVRGAGLICSHLTITLTGATGHTSVRTWRLDEVTESAIADRVRWQADGWLTGRYPGCHTTSDPALTESTDGISVVELSAAELLAPLEDQTSLFHRRPGHVGKTLERIQGLFGPAAVLVPSLQGGRDPHETNLWTPWQHEPAPVRNVNAPWPGSLPAPRPTVVENIPIDLLNSGGHTIVARPSGLDSAPATIRLPDGTAHPIANFSASWPVEAYWWDADQHQYRVRLQVVTAAGQAYVVSKERGQWAITGRYA